MRIWLVGVVSILRAHDLFLAGISIISERERVNSRIYNWHDFSYYILVSGAVCPSPCINCSTLYATPAGSRGITERIRLKLYVYFKNTTSTFRICGIYRYNVHVVGLWSHGYSGSQVEKGAPALLQKARGIGQCSMLLSRPRC